MVARPPSDSSASGKKDFPVEAFLHKLRSALKRDGDFPASAKVVSELRTLVADPKTTANQVTEVILKEPSLGTRVLALVNSSFYRRAKPIMTVSQAVIQVGMRPLAELCSSLVLLQKFVPEARRGGPFSICLKQMILTSLLASNVAAQSQASGASAKGDETGYLAGSFAEIGTLLLAYYFPQVFENAIKRSETKKQELARSITELTGLTPVQLSLEVISALNLPEFYRTALLSLQDTEQASSPDNLPAERKSTEKLGKALFAAQKISSTITHSRNRMELDGLLSTLRLKTGLDAGVLSKTVGNLPAIFREHCSSLDLALPPLPEYVSTFSGQPPAAEPAVAEAAPIPEPSFSQFLDEIREATENREPTASIITRVMETMAWGLEFSRVLLMLVNPGRTKLVGRMMLGSIEGFDPKHMERPLGPDAGSYAPDALAFRESRPVFTGDPLFEDGWPITAIPIGFGQRAIGVIYADKVGQTEEILPGRDQAAIGVLAELLDRSVSMHAK